MRRLLIILGLILAAATSTRASQAARGWCEEGAQVVLTSGLTSTTLVQQSFPLCTVTVFVHGGGLATIFSDNSVPGTPLSNPFTAQTNGQWMFYAPNGRYDIQLSGAGFPTPVTYSDVILNDVGAAGIVFGVYSSVPFSSTPVFNAAAASIFSITLTGNVTSSSVISPVQNGQVIEIYVCQDAFGGHSFTFPSNFTNISQFNLSTTGNACSPTSWWFNGSTWQPFTGGSSAIGVIPPAQGGTGTATPTAHGVAIGEGSSTPFNFSVATNNSQCFMSPPSNFATTDPFFQTCPGGGGGGSSAGPQGTVQEAGATSGSFAVFPEIDVGGAGIELQVQAQKEFKGPNPEVDVQLFGGRAVPVNAGAPYNGPGVTGVCTSGNTTIPISGAGFNRFVNGDGIIFYGCGTAHSMSTPSAPTVTPAVAVANTNTGYVATNGSAGSVNTRCYRIVASNTTQGLTAASPEVCVSGGSAILGSDPLSVTSCTRSVQTVTCVTAAHTLPIGCGSGACGAVFVSGTSDDMNFGGWFPLTTVADSTHFTYIGGLSAANGATTSATGGTFEYFNSDHLVLPAFGTGMWQYGIYEGPPGAETLVDLSQINVPALVGTPTYLTWDYYGSTYSGNSLQPLYWPTSFPTSATNNSLITTVVSGGGTSSLVVAAAPANNNTGTALFDSCPTTQAANSFANSFSGGGGITTFPPVPAVGGTTMAYVFNSNCTLTGAISQSMPVVLNDTLQFQGKWYGELKPNPIYSVSPPSAIESHIPINDVTAKPGIFFKGGSMRGVTINPSGNNYVAMFYHVPSGTSIFENMNWGSLQSVDYNGILFYDFEPSPSGGFGWTINNSTFVAGPNQLSGSSFTPLLVVKNNFEYHLNNTPMYARGMFFKALPAGFDMSINQKQEIQGLTEPQYSFYFTGGTVAGWVALSNLWADTTAQPAIANFGNTVGAMFTLDGYNGSGGLMPVVSGAPLTSLVVRGVAVDTTRLGQNVSTHVNGGAGSGEQTFNTSLIIGPSNSGFTNTLPPAAPTCSVATAGPPFTQAFASGTFRYAAVFFNGGFGPFSPPSNTCSADGVTQQATLTIPSAIPGAIGYIFSHNALQFSTLIGTSCAIPETTTLATLLGQNCGNSLSLVSSGGPAGLTNGQVWGDFFPNAPNNTANAMPSFNGSGKLIATPCVPLTAGDLCYWNGSAWTRFVGNVTGTQLFAESPSGVPSWVAQGAPFPPAGVPNSSGTAWLSSYAAPAGSLVGTGQSNIYSTGIQDFSAVSELRPKAGATASIPAACVIPDIYFATDAQPGRNWYFCTATNVWTQQVNTGDLGLNTYGGPHTLLATESWANFTATTTVTIPHLLSLNRWVVFCTSTCTTLTLAPDSGNITLNGLAPAATAAVSTGLGVEVTCDGTNCFAYGLGGSGGGGSGTVASCTVNGVAYYTAATTVNCVTPPVSPNGVPQFVTSTPSGGVSQPPAMALPGIVGRAVSGIASTDTILSTDCNPNRVEYVGSVAVAVTLPTATTLGVPKCVFKLVNTTVPAQTVTITPTTWTINGNATLPLTFGQQLWVYVDPNSTTNWVADQTDLFGNVSGGAVPASAKLIGTNASSQLIAAALSNTHIYVGSGANLPVDVALSGDATLANTGALTVIAANGGAFPTSANVMGTNASKQPVTATAHNIVLPWECADTSGSGTAQVCNTSPTFTPVAGDSIIYTTTTANTGTALTINVNSLGAKPVAKWQTSTTLAASDIKANTQVLLSYDGTNWELATVGNAPTGGGGGTPCTITNLSLQYDATGSFGCVTEFTYASSTITASTTGKLDLSSASVTAGFKVPTAAAAAPTAASIVSYDSTNNKLVYGNATNTSTPTWVTAAPTSNVIPKASGTQGLLVGSSLSDNGTVLASAEALELGTANCITFGTAGSICMAEGTSPTNVSGTDAIYPDSTAHELEVATNGSTSFGILVRSQPSPVNLTGQTALKTTTTACAASAGACNVAGQYHIHWNFWGSGTACSVVTVGSVQLQLTWTDENAVTHSAIAMPMWDQKAGAFGTNFNFNTSLATEGASGDYTISTNGTVIQYATTYTACSTGTGTYNLRLAVTRLQ